MNDAPEHPHVAYRKASARLGKQPCIVHCVECFEEIGGPPVLVRQIVHSPLEELYEFCVISYAIKGISPRSLSSLTSLLKSLHPDIVHVHGLKPDSFHAVLAARIAGIRRIVTVVHSSTGLSVSEYASMRAKIRKWLVCNVLETATLLLSHAVYTVCDHMRKDGRIRAWAGSRLRGTIHNCMDIPVVTRTKQEIRKEFGFSESDFLILFVGRICTNKGLLVLADAMDKVVQEQGQEKLKLILVGGGSGAEYEEIEQRFRYLREKNKVVFLGVHNDVFNLYTMADVFVLPIIFKENFSFSLLEAAACGIPVVATNHGGNPELVNDGVTGLLVPPGDAQALADAIGRLARDEGLRRKLGTEGQERVRDYFPVERMRAKTNALYEELLR